MQGKHIYPNIYNFSSTHKFMLFLFMIRIDLYIHFILQHTKVSDVYVYAYIWTFSITVNFWVICFQQQ